MIKDKFRTTRAILALLTILLISTGCDAFAMVGSKITGIGAGNQSDVTPSASQSSSPDWIAGTLPIGVIDSLGTGCKADIILLMVGLDPETADDGHYRFSVKEEPAVICELNIVRRAADLVILTGVLSDETGHRLLFSPTPDQLPIDDFMMKSGDLVLDVGAYGQHSILSDALGEPIRTDTSAAESSAEAIPRHFRTLYYLNLTLDLWQAADDEYADHWLISQISCTSGKYATPRGLAVGLTYQEVLSLLGTGDFIIVPDQLPSPTRLTIKKIDPVNAGSDKAIELLIKNDQVTLISVSYLGSD